MTIACWGLKVKSGVRLTRLRSDLDRGQFFLVLATVLSPPWSRMAAESARRPAQAAQWSAVKPSPSTAATSAPTSMRYQAATSQCPHASMNGVRPCSSRHSISAPSFSNSTLALSRRRLRIALNSAALYCNAIQVTTADAVGLVAGRASSLQKNLSDEVLAWLSVCSDVQMTC